MVAPIPESLRYLCHTWKGLQSIGQVINVTETGDTHSWDIRYYILSRPPRVKEFAMSTRSHWSIESMHWVLDVVFGEDACRLRNGAAAENYSFLRKLVNASAPTRNTAKSFNRDQALVVGLARLKRLLRVWQF